MSRRLSLLSAAALGIAAVYGFLPLKSGRTQPVDPTLPVQRVVGDPAGAAPTDRVDAERSGRARQLLPRMPSVVFRARVPGGIDHPVVVDERGALIAAGTQLVEIDHRGRVAWSLRTGAALPAAAPAILSDGTRVVVTAAPELFMVQRSGTLKLRKPLPGASMRFVAPPLPLDDGGLAIAVAGELMRAEPNGELWARASLDDPVRALVRSGDAIAVVTGRGEVYSWRPPELPKRLGSFGGRIDDGAALSGPAKLTAVVAQTRVVDLSLVSGARANRIGDGLLVFRGPPAIMASGEIRLVSADGQLLGYDAAGRETLRVALEPPVMLGDSGAPPPNLFGAPPVVVDAEGRVGFVRPGLEAGVVTSDGSVSTAKGAACADPVSIAPAGSRRLVVACRSGLLFMLGEAASRQ